LNSIMAMLSLTLPEQGGVLAHGIGVRRNKEGFLFLAPSGGGKSTLAMRCSGSEVLADDGIIIRKRSNSYKIFPTPFRQCPGGEISKLEWALESIVLKGAFLLEKGNDIRLNRIPRFQLVHSFLGSFSHFFLWMDNIQAKSVFDFWHEFSLRLPIARLSWRPDLDFWPQVYDFIHEVD
ncbi:hypothetical protein ACFL1Z_04745, partial [Thermodesulfobacteriota bacterium]